MHRIGIRREDKNRWERRVPLTPRQVRELSAAHGIRFTVQPSRIRAFPDDDYRKAGATVAEDLSECPVILAVKEIPTDLLMRDKTYVFFSHTMKRQPQNMPMLRRLMELNCTLIDYEKIVDENSRRVVFFGRFAGLAGMVDTLWALGRRLASRGIPSPFQQLKQTVDYADLSAIKAALSELAAEISEGGIPEALRPFIVGFIGYGNSSKGAQEILDCLPLETITPSDIRHGLGGIKASSDRLYKVVFRETDTVEPISSSQGFDLKDYYDHPERYRAVFGRSLPSFTVLMNCIYWERRYPRLVSNVLLRETYAAGMRLQIVGDISADVRGSIECTAKVTTPDCPVFTVDPTSGAMKDGFDGEGIAIMAVDNLPCELPRESSAEFGERLQCFVPEIAGAAFDKDFDRCGLSPLLRRATILYRGKLTADFRYLDTVRAIGATGRESRSA